MYILKVYKYTCFYLIYAYANPLIDMPVINGSCINPAFAGVSGSCRG